MRLERMFAYRLIKRHADSDLIMEQSVAYRKRIDTISTTYRKHAVRAINDGRCVSNLLISINNALLTL